MVLRDEEPDFSEFEEFTEFTDPDPGSRLVFWDLFNDEEIEELFPGKTRSDLRESPYAKIQHKNWNSPNYWKIEKEQCTGKLPPDLYEFIMQNYNKKVMNFNVMVQKFIRTFLLDRSFRIRFVKESYQQRKRDFQKYFRKKTEEGEVDTDQNWVQKFTSYFRYTKGGKVYNYEKICLFFYSAFVIDQSVSYLIKCFLQFAFEKKEGMFEFLAEETRSFAFESTPQVLFELYADRKILAHCFQCQSFFYDWSCEKCGFIMGV